LADAKDQLSENEMAMLKKDIYASHVYESLVTNAVSHNSYNEYKRPLVIL
jgi:hypothetical protein